jgi:hypothetical protein
VAIAVLAVGVGSVFLRDPNLGVAGATADPHAEDPFAAALGVDLPRWRTDNAPSSPLPPTELDAELAMTDGSPPAVVGIVGPADPADRD